jgi:hypothetical protein
LPEALGYAENREFLCTGLRFMGGKHFSKKTVKIAPGFVTMEDVPA